MSIILFSEQLCCRALYGLLKQVRKRSRAQKKVEKKAPARDIFETTVHVLLKTSLLSTNLFSGRYTRIQAYVPVTASTGDSKVLVTAKLFRAFPKAHAKGVFFKILYSSVNEQHDHTYLMPVPVICQTHLSTAMTSSAATHQEPHRVLGSIAQQLSPMWRPLAAARLAATAASAAVASPSADTVTLRAGIIGLDTSHSTAFTKVLNADCPSPEFAGCRIVAATPRGVSIFFSCSRLVIIQ